MINKHFIRTSTTAKHQSGVVLVISLVMLLALTLIGVTSSNVTGLQEKMSANSKDINLAFQAAETALRSAEDFVGQTDYQSKLKGKFTRTAKVTDTSWTTSQGVNGYYTILDNTETTTVDAEPQEAQPDPPFYLSVNWDPAASPKKYMIYDENSTVKKLDNVYYRPEYIIEEIGNTGSEDGGDGSLEGGAVKTASTGRVVTFRITAHGWGSNPNSIVTIQSVAKVTYN